MRNSVLLALCLFAAQATAQSYFIPDNVTTSGGCNVIPFGHNIAGTWSNQRYQSYVTPADINNLPVAQICELAFLPCVSGLRHFDTIEVVMAQTNTVPLSSTFSANLTANVQTVLKATNYDWTQTADTWTRIGLDRPFLYIAAQGSNIVIQVTVTGAVLRTTSTSFPGHRTFARQRLYNYNWTGTPPLTASGQDSSAAVKLEVILDSPDLNTFGTGCPGPSGTPTLSFTGSAKLGGNATIDLSGALANTLTALAIDVQRLEPAIDLTVVRAPGCSMYVRNVLTVFGVANGNGIQSLPVNIPTTGKCLRVYVQWFCRDSVANPFGWTTSNYGRMLLGS
ncbi:MAG: hypothetical protein KDC87_08885 [Planctomycetes bacterium]|nr:hypothetical protein [Planctomycetota bacterium]MCB9870211.1 hypothetical protein [Planctomycetota bacterium]MCB9888209.1 hypothetical protein [Planctomycetota bacterium]